MKGLMFTLTFYNLKVRDVLDKREILSKHLFYQISVVAARFYLAFNNICYKSVYKTIKQ